MLSSRRQRLLRAQFRDNLILLREFRLALILFLVFFVCGTLLFWMLYEHPADRSQLAAMTAGQVEQTLDVNLVLHKRGRTIDHRPDHNVVLQGGDHIIVFATLNGIERAKKLNESKRAGN